MLLAGDIGGTKTNLAVFSPDEGPRDPLVEATFPSSHYHSLEDLVRQFLQRITFPVDRACFGVAGPVVGGQAQITNLPWDMNEQTMSRELSLAKVKLLNDLEAIAHGVPLLIPSDLHTLTEGAPAQNGAMAIVAPGTGLGEAFLMWDGQHFRAHSSEGGHTDFAPTDDQQLGLLQYLLERYEHVSYERVCSGIGLPNIYNYLKDTGYAREPDWLARQLAAVDDPTPVIVQSALAGHEGAELCSATLDIFVSILAAEAGNLALKVLATGGIYLGGGIPPRILSVLGSDRFIHAFQRKGRFYDLLRDVPVHVILNSKVALFGAARFGLEMSAS